MDYYTTDVISGETRSAESHVSGADPEGVVGGGAHTLVVVVVVVVVGGGHSDFGSIC